MLRIPYVRIRRRLLLVSSAMLWITGCANIEVVNLVPDTSTVSDNEIQRSLSAVDVVGAQEEVFGGAAMVSAADFKSAMVSTLHNSGIFQSVTDGADGELNMYAEFEAQGQAQSGLDYRTALVVTYWIVEKDSGKEVWRESFNSRHEVKFTDAFSGNTRTVRAQEGSVRKNLAQLVEALSAWSYP